MNGDFREDLKRACEVMQKGGVILYPTDTIWGIAVLYCNQFVLHNS